MSSVGETAVGRQPGASLLGLHARRMWKDRLFRWAMAAGGTAVFVALLLIFVYLLYVVAPIFAGATVHPATESPLAAGAGATRHIALDEYAEVALRVTDAGRYSFIRTATNEVIESRHFAGLETGDAPVEQLRVVAGDPGTGLIAVASRAGVLLAQSSYSVSYPGDVRLVTPAMTYPFGPVPIVIGGGGDLPAALAVQALEDEAVIVALDRNGRLQATRVTRELNFLTEEVSIEQETEQLAAGLVGATMLRLAEDLRSLIVADEVGGLTVYDIRAPGNATAWPRVQVTAGAARTTALEFLSGASSIVVGESSGTISQWFPVRGENGQPALTRIRDFTDLNAPVASIVPEHDRKGFIAITESGDIGVYHATAHRTLARTSFSDGRPTAIGISPRADRLIAVTADDKLTQARIENEHPEISLHALWQKVWYESRAEPQYIWQSSSASSDFEPKFSLMPLTFGTLKAAFYAMLFAVPMAVLGAIYTAYFMSAPMRRIVKPSIEIMEALPTVILGFLAGLWFAPFVERNMPGFFLIMLLLPPALIGAGYLWRFAPHRVRHRFPDGSEALLLLPVVCLTIAVA
ncbi:MAG: phosphate ABC transporter permease, partial [Gammaproteobacteria bacterium]|nr:phosphate ABC transporter permease [Gammaproteobacteria bacterium]NNM00865.1 phosphate ABC transporter permease [Gammaproteobacteria bacterium]